VTDAQRRKQARDRLLKLYRSRGKTTAFCWLRYWHSNVACVERHIPLDGAILDLGCGHGVLANYLALASPDRRVVGYDLSEHRIAVAQSLGVENAEFHCQNLFETDPEPCRVLIVADVLHHLPSLEAGAELLARCMERLEPDGLLVVKEIAKRPLWKFIATQPLDLFFYKGGVHFRTAKQFGELFERLGVEAEFVPLHAWRPLPHVMYLCRRRRIR